MMNKFENLSVKELNQILIENDVKKRSSAKTKQQKIDMLRTFFDKKDNERQERKVEEKKGEDKKGEEEIQPHDEIDYDNVVLVRRSSRKNKMSEQDKKYLEENIVHFLFRNPKSENDFYNKIREEIIFILLKNFETPLELFPENSLELVKNLRLTMMKYGVKRVIECKKIGGRMNVDFYLKYYNPKNQIQEINLEFKNSSKKIDDLPQFIQIYTNNKELSLYPKSFHEFYFDNYVPEICKVVGLDMPTKKEYIQRINETKKEKKTFHQQVYLFYKKSKKNQEQINSISKKAIDEYLSQLDAKDFNLSGLNKKFKEQENKVYLMTEKGKFYMENMEDYLKINKVKGIKNKNTVVLQSENDKAEIHCLLRWKNGNGCIGPAWQISLKIKK
jgi:hypothetical protein